MAVSYDSHFVCCAAGTTLSQLDHFTRSGVLTPVVKASRRGISRRYDLPMVRRAAIAGRLMKSGVSVADSKKLFEAIGDQYESFPYLISWLDGTRRVWMTTHGENVRRRADEMDSLLVVNVRNVLAGLGQE